MPLLFEGRIADLMCPDSSVDSLAEPDALPGVRVTRIAAVAFQERRLQGGCGLELLSGQPSEIRVRRPEIRAAEIDDADDAMMDEPVARLPVTMSRYKYRGRRRPRFNL